jgi:Sec-independent protein translocase protein TatA
MPVIAANNLVITTKAVPVLKPSDVLDDKDSSKTPAAETKPAEGVVVSLSGAGLKASQSSTNPNQDIDDSNLKDAIKELLKMIRELRKQIAAKMAELSAAMADTSLSPQARQAKVARVQGDVATLQAGLMTAMGQLAKALKSEPPEAQMEAMKLLAK